jgi:hypothetical protein
MDKFQVAACKVACHTASVRVGSRVLFNASAQVFEKAHLPAHIRYQDMCWKMAHLRQAKRKGKKNVELFFGLCPESIEHPSHA